MKIVTLTLIMLLAICLKARSVEKMQKADETVSFEILLDKTIKNVPYIIVYEQGVYPKDATGTGQKKVVAQLTKGNTYLINLHNQPKPLYFNIYLSNQPYDYTAGFDYHFEPGDHIRIKIKPTKVYFKFDLEFSGVGSAKYLCRNECISVQSTDTASHKSRFILGTEYDGERAQIRHMNLMYNVIEKYRPELSSYSYNLLHADIVGAAGYEVCSTLCGLFSALRKKGDTLSFNKLASTFKARFKYDFTANVPAYILAESKDYVQFLLLYLRAKTMMKDGFANYKTYYGYIEEESNTLLRDKLILSFFTSYWPALGDDFDNCLNNSLKTVKDPSILARLKEFDKNRVGKYAYNFSLKNVEGKVVTLNDFRGKVVFIDFWYTGCGACKGYYKNVLSKVEESYAKNTNVVFITISPDMKNRWLESLQNGQYTSSKVVNLFTNDEGYKHEIIKYYNVRGYPRPIVISKTGKIASIDEKILRNESGLISVIEHELVAGK